MVFLLHVRLARHDPKEEAKECPPGTVAIRCVSQSTGQNFFLVVASEIEIAKHASGRIEKSSESISASVSIDDGNVHNGINRKGIVIVILDVKARGSWGCGPLC